jgi:predicted O-methyltransferase YrrM
LAVFKKIATDGYGSNRCLKKGFLPVPVHYYSPIPDIDDLKKRKIWNKKSQMYGLDFNQKEQLTNLKNLGRKFGQECVWPLDPTKNPADFYVNNLGFSYGCASILYSMIREHKPKNIIEIGSGLSSKVIAKAISANASEGVKTKYTIIDPYPGEDITNRTVKSNRLIPKCVEVVNPKIFEQLGKNDILFIDSSHTVKIGSDVNFLYLEILPMLAPGVIIHMHDISLPYEYSKVYATNEVFRQFWTEQYLLQSFLCLNKEFEILLAMNYLMQEHLPQLKKAFPYYDPKMHHLTSGSFWIRRCLRGKKQ